MRPSGCLAGLNLALGAIEFQTPALGGYIFQYNLSI